MATCLCSYTGIYLHGRALVSLAPFDPGLLVPKNGCEGRDGFKALLAAVTLAIYTVIAGL